MRALTKFDISSNKLWGAKALAEGLKGNQVITELNMVGIDTSGVITLADVIPDMGALTTLMFGDNQPVTMTTEMTEANFGGKLMFESYEAQIVAAFLPKCT
jgi:hypothetical protein